MLLPLLGTLCLAALSSGVTSPRSSSLTATAADPQHWPSPVWKKIREGRDYMTHVLQCPARWVAHDTLDISTTQRMRRVNRSQGTGAPGAPASGPCPAPSPLEVGQLLLQQEHVGFELIPLLKDLLNLLSTEAALPCLGGEPWRRRGIRLWKDRLGQGAPRLDSDARGLAGRLGRPGRYHGCQAGALAESRGGGRLAEHTRNHLPASLLALLPTAELSRVPTESRTGPSSGTHRVLGGPRGSCARGRPLGLPPLLAPGPRGLALHRLRRRLHGRFAPLLSLALAVPRSAQLGLYRGQLLPQLRIHQQEALQLLLQLWAEPRGWWAGRPRAGRAPRPARRPAPPSPPRSPGFAAAGRGCTPGVRPSGGRSPL